MSLKCPTCSSDWGPQFSYAVGGTLYCPICVEVDMNEGEPLILNSSQSKLKKIKNKRKKTVTPRMLGGAVPFGKMPFCIPNLKY